MDAVAFLLIDEPFDAGHSITNQSPMKHIRRPFHRVPGGRDSDSGASSSHRAAPKTPPSHDEVFQAFRKLIDNASTLQKVFGDDAAVSPSITDLFGLAGLIEPINIVIQYMEGPSSEKLLADIRMEEVQEGSSNSDIAALLHRSNLPIEKILSITGDSKKYGQLMSVVNGPVGRIFSPRKSR